MKDIHKGRQRYILLLFLIATIVLIVKAMQIQLLDTSYQDRARATAINKYVLYPSRGLILDRNNKLLVNNNAMYDLMVTYRQISPEMDTTKFCDLLGISTETFEKKINKNWKSRRFSKSVPFAFLSKISAETYARFQESMYEFPGFFVQVRNVRGYPHNNAAHALGYLNEVNRTQVDTSRGVYLPGDYIGATGLELAYEKELRGHKGVQYLLKDNLGRVVGPYKGGQLDSAATSGKDLITSLDIDLQSYGEYLLQNKVGSIVAIEPSSGEVLAMISAPSYNPNWLTINRNRGEVYRSLIGDSLRPLFDRAITAKYPPGSIFKTVVGLVAMEEEVSHANRGISCSGGYFYNGRLYKCHDHSYASNVGIALQHSCNAYFFQTVRDIIDKNGFYNPHKGLDTFVNHLHDFGLGEPLGVDLPGELGGNVPTSEYYDYLYPKNEGSWKSPTVMSIGIGQGEIQMTTLQMANLAAIIANRGYYYTPHLVKAFREENNNIIAALERYRKKKVTRINPKFYPSIVDGMERVIKKGTAQIARIDDIDICGKTGTSQNPHGKDHSVFFAFAPKNDPKIAIAVYVEHGVWGARYGAPIASLMIEKYLKGEIAENRKFLEERMLNANLVGQP